MFTAQNERFLRGWESRRGEPLADIPVDPPVFAGHPRVARSFSRAIAHFVIRVFHNRETEYYDQANDAIIRNSKFYIENTDVRDDRDSFYWNIGEICRAILHYGTLGDEEPGLVSPEAEKIFLEMAYGYCNDMSKLDDANCEPKKTWRIYESENHHVQRDSALWQLMLLLIRYGHGDKPLADGGDVKFHFQAWTDFFTTWMKERAGRSMFVEIQSKVYGVHTMKNVYPLYDFAPTPELKELTGNFITLFWALWAQEQINGIQGGGQSRIYPGSAVVSKGENLLWAWYYSGIGEFHAPEEMEYVMLDCGYRLPQIVVDMINNPQKRGTYTTESRPFGKSAPDDLFPNYRPVTDWGHIYRYSYCTPDYILGTLMCPQLTKKGWLLISSQNRFQGVTFGKMDAMVLPIPEPDELHNLHSTIPTVGFNSYWSEQAEGTLITQRCADYGAPMRVFFSGAGDVRANVTEKDGWYFTYCDNAYVAVKICQGGFIWEDDAYVPGQWMRCDVATTPVIVETANASQYATLADFQDAVTKLAPTWDGAVMKYHSLYGHDFVFVTDADSEKSTIDGEYYVKKPDFSAKSPFVNNAWGGSEAKITFDGQELILNF
jgi:hypothetical protein